jgi:hypothetical protein
MEEWWEVPSSSSGADLNLISRMFDPSCGLLSKKNELKWTHIRTRILPDLTEAGVTAKTEEFQRRLLAIAAELLELDNHVDEDDDVGDVNQDI